MASPVTNRCANYSSRSIGQKGRQSRSSILLVKTSRRSVKEEPQYKSKRNSRQAQDVIEESDIEDRFVDLKERSIASKPSTHCWQPKENTCKSGGKDHKTKKRESSLEVWGSTAIEAATSQDSEPVRPAKRRKIPLTAKDPCIIISSSPVQPTNLRVRKALVESSTKSSVSRDQGFRLNQRSEIGDSCETDKIVESSSFAHIVVEIPVYEDFNRDAYAKVLAPSTQSTLASQLETRLELPRRQQSLPATRTFEVTIPDSQEFLIGSSAESLDYKTTIRPSHQRTVTGIPGGSNVEGKTSTLEVSSPFQTSPAAGCTQSALSLAENLNSSPTEIWQGAQIIPGLELTTSQIKSAGLNFEIYQENTENQVDISPHEVQYPSEYPVLSEREVNSQHTNSKTKGPKASSLVIQGNYHQTKFPVTEDKTTRATSEYSAPVGLHISPRRPLSSSLHLACCVDTSDSILPPRPYPPSNSEMTDSDAAGTSSKMSYADLAMLARDEVKARLLVSSGATNIEKLSSSPAPNATYQMLPVRENVVGIHPLASMEETLDDDDKLSESGAITLRLPKLRSSDYVVLLPLASMVREVYGATLTKCNREITAFLNDDEIAPRVVEQMDAMIQDLKMLTDHQDLITNMTLTQSAVSSEHQAKWAETCSTKCLFLRHFLEHMRRCEKHIAVLVRNGRMLDILESILKVHGIIYERPDKPSRINPRAVGPLRVTLLPTGLDGEHYVVNRADAVIAFDETFRASDRYSSILRKHIYEPGRLSPLISLVVASSAEHIDLCLPKLDDPLSRKALLVYFIAQKHTKVGELAEGMPLPVDAAVAVASYLQNDNPMWPLPENADIVGLEVDASQQKQIQSGLNAQSQDHDSLQSITPHGATKRTLRAESISGPDPDSGKRMRMTPTRGDATSSGDVTRVSDSVIHHSQVPPASIGDTAYDSIAKVNALDEEQSRQISLLLEKVDNLELELQNKQSTEDQLRQHVKALEARLEDHVSTIKKFQPKLRQAIADRGKFQAERDAAKLQVLKLTETIEARGAEIAKFNEGRAKFETELATARAALSNSTVPEVAKVSQAQEQVRTLQAEKDLLEKRILSMRKDFDFTRDSYQTASSYATELKNELSALKDENIVLQRKASENIIRIAEIQRTNEIKEREERIEELEAQLRERDQELRKKAEELKIKMNGRRETRGTSVPRSPRIGSGAMSPQPHLTRTARGSGSRGASPAPGDAREGFRDATLFAPLARERWTHLT